MKHQKKHLPSIGRALIVCALLLTLAGCASAFEGDSVKNADTYALNIQTMSGTDLHTMDLKEGDALQIQFETMKGSLYMEIKAPDGTTVYRGNGKETTEFTLDIPQDGVYAICVEAKQAKGTLCVSAAKAAQSDTQSVDANPPDADTPAVTAEDLAGPWHLAAGKNDEAAVNEAFPGAMELGSGMELTGDGRIVWYIGADGGTGTYTLSDDRLSAHMTNDLDGTAMAVELTAERQDRLLLLTMEYKNLTLCWSQGEGETGKGES